MIRPADQYAPTDDVAKLDSIVDRLIDSQQQLTAVERFSQRHQAVTTPANESLYRDLIPLTAPEVDEQYSFEIDLDACSGCKACVAACHSLNGLDEGEIWRNVGLLTGPGEEEASNPVVQHVTSACHHCLEPACMHGCPVRAYEKDPVTGIVEHLDDQCIGCKYCMFTCPYDVPSYSKSKGIVRKCNMCADRLQVGQAPACVQACPNEAIKIRKIKREPLKNRLLQSEFAPAVIPGAPDSRLTFPTTRYVGGSENSATALPVDFHAAKPQHAHLPLVFMLTLTQLALGVFACSWLLTLFRVVGASTLFALNVFGMVALVAGLGVATLHLGRPDKAYRAMSGFRTSWLSREIIGFNVFAGAASTLVSFGMFEFLSRWFGDLSALLSWSTLIAGILAVECSVMLYVVTGRPLWNAMRTHALFFLTAAMTGFAATSTIGAFGGASVSVINGLLMGVVLATIAKLSVEAQLFAYLKSAQPSPTGLSAQLLVGSQRPHVIVRVTCAVFGGVLLPLLGIGLAAAGFDITWLTVMALIVVFAGELVERYLFFAVSVARRMPGAPN